MATTQSFEPFFNSQRFSDVRFVFPSEPTKPVIHGHKIMFANVSLVFDKMFSGNFADEDEIEIHGIKHDIFLEMVRYIYTGQGQLTKSNMAEVLYTVQKYMLDNVKAEVENFVLANTTSDNLLEMMNACEMFERKEITEKCCNMICDDPLRFFTKTTWLKLSPRALKMIVSQRQMNCMNQQLREFVAAWQSANRCETSVNFELDLGLKPFLNLETKYFTGDFQSDYYKTVNMWVDLRTPINLHGIGLYLGIQIKSDQLNQDIRDYREPVEIIVWDSSSLVKVNKTVMVIQQPTTFIECIMFEKTELSGKITISITFQSNYCRPRISTHEGKIPRNFKTFRCRSFADDGQVAAGQNHCLAYILTSDVNKSP